MKDELVRFGVAMDAPLLTAFDALVEERGGTRSEALRDLVRGEVTKARVREAVDAVATLTIVYDHHVRDLTERLTEFQHALGEQVRSTLHIHLDHDNCLEVIVLKGRSDELRRSAEKLLATRGVKHGGIEIIATGAEDDAHTHAHTDGGVTRVHTHAVGHSHSHAPAPKRAAAATKKKR